MFSNFIAIRVIIATIRVSLSQALYSLQDPTLFDDRTEFYLHPPSEASGRVGNRAYSEIAGEGWRGRSAFKRCERPSPATPSLADPSQTTFGEGEDVADQREVSILSTKIPDIAIVIMRTYFFLLAIMSLNGMSSAIVRGIEPVVFVSSFASGNKGGIHAFRFDSERGTLKTLHCTKDINNPFFIALSPNKRFLYAIDAEKFGGSDEEDIAAYALEDRTGRMKLLNRQSTRGTASCFLDVDPSGRSLLVANYKSGSVASLPIASDGSLGEAISFFQHSGSSINPQRQTGPNAHCFVVSPDGRFALAADLGIDKIMIYALDAVAAKLSPNAAQPYVKLTPGSGPRHLMFHPMGKFVYVINELANTITVFDWNAIDGALTEKQTISTLPKGITAKSHTADLKITPDGKYLYGTNRGHDSLASFRIAEDGTLALLKILSSNGKGPQNLLVTPDGRWLLCANMPGNSVVVFKIDASTGDAALHGESVEIPMPSCIRWVD